MRTVVAMYDSIEHARMAIEELRDTGFRGEDINLITRDSKGDYQRQLDDAMLGDKTRIADENSDGAATGAGIGAVMGGLTGLLVGLGALAIPGIGPVVAAGPIISALAGAGVGAVAGGLVGALTDIGVPEEHANIYAEGVRRGSTLVVVRAADDNADQALSVLNRHHPVDIQNQADMWRQENWSRFDENAGPYDRETTGMGMTTEYPQTRSSIPVTGDLNTDMGEDEQVENFRGRHDYDRVEGDDNIPVTGATFTGDRDRTDLDTGDMGYSAEGQQFGRHGDQDMDRLNNMENIPVTGGLSEDLSGHIDEDDEQHFDDSHLRNADYIIDESNIPVTGGWNEERGTDFMTGDQTVNPLHDEEELHDFDSVRGQDRNIPVTGGMIDDRDEAFRDQQFGQRDRFDDLNTDDLEDDTDNIPVTGRMDTPTMTSMGTGSMDRMVDDDSLYNDWDRYDSMYQTHYHGYYSSGGMGYEYYQPAYRYGYELGRDDRYRDYDWTMMEGEARSEWERRGIPAMWEDVKDAVKHAWESVRR